jgi:hypothetical protein
VLALSNEELSNLDVIADWLASPNEAAVGVDALVVEAGPADTADRLLPIIQRVSAVARSRPVYVLSREPVRGLEQYPYLRPPQRLGELVPSAGTPRS